MNYPGKELEIFDKAHLWRGYLYLILKKFIGKKILEVGAGIGSFTKIYFEKSSNITLSEIDNSNHDILIKKFSLNKNVKVENKIINEFNETFDTILYLSVLEHIENDEKEIANALDRLEEGGHLIICAPAHNYMYSNFDKEIGHFRRYEMSFFNKLSLKNAFIKKKFFIDSLGHLIYFLNKIAFSKEVYPSKLKIFIWDKILIPVTFIVDFFSFYKFGKNIICIIEKKSNN